MCTGARCLWGGDGARKLDARARCAALVVVGPCPMDGRCAVKKLLSFGAQPLCDVPAAASNAKLAATYEIKPREPALAVSGQEAEHASLLRAKAVPRWTWSARIPWGGGTASTRSVYAWRAAVVRRASCGLQFQAGRHV